MSAFESAVDRGVNPMFTHKSKLGFVLAFYCEETDSYFAEFYLHQALDQPQMTLLFNELNIKASAHGHYIFNQAKSFLDIQGKRSAFDLSLVRW